VPYENHCVVPHRKLEHIYVMCVCVCVCVCVYIERERGREAHNIDVLDLSRELRK
jgi:hypothetical protein